MTASSPLIIGATGGSGTRVVARIVQRAGYDLGTYLNEANDALALRPFHDRWIYLQRADRHRYKLRSAEQSSKNERISGFAMRLSLSILEG